MVFFINFFLRLLVYVRLLKYGYIRVDAAAGGRVVHKGMHPRHGFEPKATAELCTYKHTRGYPNDNHFGGTRNASQPSSAALHSAATNGQTLSGHQVMTTTRRSVWRLWVVH
jgi:hypothetical protein